MNGYSGHTFKWVNSEGKAVWVRYHFKTDSGIKNMDVEKAANGEITSEEFERLKAIIN